MASDYGFHTLNIILQPTAHLDSTPHHSVMYVIQIVDESLFDNAYEKNVSSHLGVRICISRNMAMASPETEMTLACFITWEWNASTGSSPANSEDGIWNRISVKLTGASSF